MTELKYSLTSYFEEKIQRIKDLEVTYNTFKRVVESSESDEEAKNNLKKEFSIFNRGNDKFEDEFNKFIEQIEKGYTPTLPKLQINESKKIKIKTMKKQLNEIKRMQKLAGLINESQTNNIKEVEILNEDITSDIINFVTKNKEAIAMFSPMLLLTGAWLNMTKSEYKNIKTTDPNINTMDAIRKALEITAEKITQRSR